MIQEFIPEELQEGYKHVRKWVARSAAAALIASAAFGTGYTVNRSETAVLTRFGKHVGNQGSGLHFKAPFITKVQKVPTEEIQKLEFGFRTVRAGENSEFLDGDNVHTARSLDAILDDYNMHGDNNLAAELLQSEYLMLTGDLSMADVEFEVQYQIVDPAAFSFNVRDVVGTLRDEGLNVMRKIIGNGSIDGLYSSKRSEYEVAGRTELQSAIDKYDMGIRIRQLKFQGVDPPKAVRAAWNEVNQAEQEKKQKIDSAWQEYNTEVPKARGQAQEIVSVAEGYAAERVNNAQGDTARFVQIAEQWNANPDITERKIFYERQKEFLGNLKEVYIMDENGVVPLLPLQGGVQ